MKGTKEWWQKFHKDLDFAVATMIDEKSKPKIIFLPSQHTLMEFMTYSNKKQLGEEG